MNAHYARVVCGLLALGLGWLLAACATQADLRSTSRDLLGKNEELRNELKEARQRSAELETSLRAIKGQDLSQILGQLETQRRDIETLQSGLDDQKAQVYALNQKLATQLTRLQEDLAAVEKKLLVAEKVREIVTTLSTQVDQQAGTLGKLEEAIKQEDLQTRALSAEVNRFQGVLAQFDKVLRALNDKATDVERRVSELAGRLEVKVGTLATQQRDQAVKLDALEKTLAAAVATVNETSRGLGELKRVMEESVGKQAMGGEVQEAIVPAGPGLSAKDPSTGTSRAAPAPTLSDKEAYDRAQQHYGQGRYDVALTSFRLFLSQYPDSPLVSNAHFWIGECYVRARDYERGLEEYEHVIKSYPKSVKAAPALYRKAMAFLELNNKEAAKSALRQLIADYPKSQDSQRAKAKLASLK
ncbi:MAG TPA: tol-pal system protein YbgF [Nitrospirales bacterium]|jgi:tol-pal system protein YbgF|nr:tol-pal system protein YbgF [Nitrospirales bacterium]